MRRIPPHPGNPVWCTCETPLTPYLSKGGYMVCCRCGGKVKTELEPEAAKAAAIEGAQRADDAAHEEWKEHALEAIRVACQESGMYTRVTTDPAWILLDKWEVPPVREPKAMSGRCAAATRAGYWEPTGVYVNSELRRGHNRKVQVYVSLIGPPPDQDGLPPISGTDPHGAHA